MSTQQLLQIGIEKAHARRQQQINEAAAAFERGDGSAYNALRASLTERAAKRRSIAEIRAAYIAAAQG